MTSARAVDEDLDAVQVPARQPGALDERARRLLVTCVHVHLSVDVRVGRRRGVVLLDDHGPSAGTRVCDRVLESHPAEVGQLVRRAGLRAGHDMRECPALRAALLAVHEDPLGRTPARRRVVERGDRRQVGRAEPVERDVGSVAVRPVLVCEEDGLDEIRARSHLERFLVDHPFGDERALAAMRTDDTARARELVIHEQGERPVTVVERTEPIRDPDELVARAGRRVANGEHRGRRDARRQIDRQDIRRLRARRPSRVVRRDGDRSKDARDDSPDSQGLQPSHDCLPFESIA